MSPMFRKGITPFQLENIKINDEILQKYCQGMTDRSGSSQDTLSRLACMLKAFRDANNATPAPVQKKQLP